MVSNMMTYEVGFAAENSIAFVLTPSPERNRDVDLCFDIFHYN